jgi:hypothetical protein
VHVAWQRAVEPAVPVPIPSDRQHTSPAGQFSVLMQPTAMPAAQGWPSGAHVSLGPPRAPVWMQHWLVAALHVPAGTAHATVPTAPPLLLEEAPTPPEEPPMPPEEPEEEELENPPLLPLDDPAAPLLPPLLPPAPEELDETPLTPLDEAPPTVASSVMSMSDRAPHPRSDAMASAAGARRRRRSRMRWLSRIATAMLSSASSSRCNVPPPGRGT